MLRVLGFAGDGSTIIGGLVPTLLVPVVDPAYAKPHVGTRDVDLCLSIALLEEGAEGYERMETQLRQNGFEPSDVTFRWLHPSGTEVEFFCPAGKGRVAGRMYRPRPGRGRQTMGSRLTALALNAGELLTAERRLVKRTVPLPGGAGLMDFEFPVTGPAGFMAAKVAALVERNKDKDAYDLVWLLDAWPGGPAGLAQEIAEDAAQRHSAAIGALNDQLAAAFASENHHGSISYARFVGADANLDQRADLAFHAHGAVQAYLAAM
ncbi:nucleotidyl transferase AbiEii/AbiGii toxin family protein [Labedaea rhizosphaerae]|uniref:Nucleotidyltransferase AbiEii toxin of type IV toxin-antitoxin system n=1 Tax=Labedaea rhizosphaerae TaxID=598644 RepID=A0A4R6SN45_LABRH|nr:nucleotidyl transferase AbiEii/AbiGii toxin family protein [Labedaea rhizosphaerae]TDQ04990.1 nucleotidyltransferase AbiEii toxin of type IV toxin-antitoxin system [Labedaea rhizosphaerae]